MPPASDFAAMSDPNPQSDRAELSDQQPGCQSPEQVVCSISMAQRRELLEDLGMPSDVHSAALLVTLTKQTRSLETALRMLHVPELHVPEPKVSTQKAA